MSQSEESTDTGATGDPTNDRPKNRTHVHQL